VSSHHLCLVIDKRCRSLVASRESESVIVPHVSISACFDLVHETLTSCLLRYWRRCWCRDSLGREIGDLWRQVKAEVIRQGRYIKVVIKEAAAEVTSPDYSILTFSVVVEKDWIELATILRCKPVNAKVEVVVRVVELCEPLIYTIALAIELNLRYP
jgi:hypothetical protein